MEENNKLKRFDNEALPSFFKDLSEEQQKAYLDKLASDNADLKRIASEKVIQSKVAEHDMTNDLEFLKQIETENKVVSVKRKTLSSIYKYKTKKSGILQKTQQRRTKSR
jgi:uncharacterized protein YPO0396